MSTHVISTLDTGNVTLLFVLTKPFLDLESLRRVLLHEELEDLRHDAQGQDECTAFSLSEKEKMPMKVWETDVVVAKP